MAGHLDVEQRRGHRTRRHAHYGKRFDLPHTPRDPATLLARADPWLRASRVTPLIVRRGDRLAADTWRHPAARLIARRALAARRPGRAHRQSPRRRPGPRDQAPAPRVLRIARKDGKASTEPLAPIVLHARETYIGARTSGPIFLNADGIARLSYSIAYKLIRRLVKLAGIAGASTISPHSLRHSFATES